jgi:hypothetical protein
MSSIGQASRRISSRNATPASLLEMPPALNLKNISRTFQVHVYNSEHGGYTEHRELKSVSLQKGTLSVNGAPVAQPLFGRNFARFAGDHEQGFSSGVLNFTPDGHAFTGKVFLGTSANTAEAHDVAGITPDTVYHTRLCKQGAAPAAGFPLWSPPEPAGADQWEDGLELILGYRFSQTGSLPTPVFQINDLTGKNDPVDIPCIPSVDPRNQNLILTLIPDPDLAGLGVGQYGPLFPAAFVIELSWDGASFRGALQRYDAATGQPTKLQYAWQGTAKSATQPSTVRAAKVSAVHPATPAPVSIESPELSIAELFTLQPDPQTLQTYQFDLLLQNMKWALGNNPPTQDWDRNFYAEVPPQGLGKDRTDLISKDKSFYTDRLAVAFLGYSFNRMTGPGAPDTKLSDSQAVDLIFYLRAGLAADAGYSRQSKGVFLEAFLQTLPRLGNYISDQATHTTNSVTDPDHDWAQKFFDQLTTPVMMNITVDKILGGLSMDDMHRQSTVLQALQPSGDLAARHHKSVLSALLSRAVDHLNLNDPKAVQAWLGDGIQGFLAALEQDRLNVPGMDVRTQAELTAAASALEQAVKQAGGIADLAASLAEVVVAIKETSLWERLNLAETRLERAGALFAKAIHAIAITGGLANAIMAYRGWDEENATEKANTVASTAEIAAAVFEYGTKWTISTVNTFRRFVAGLDTLQRIAQQAGDSNEEIAAAAIRVRESISQPGVNEPPSLPAVEETRWGAAFEKSVTKVVRGISVVVSAAFLITAAFDFDKTLHDPNADDFTKAMDGLTLAANITVFVAVAADILLPALAVVPIIGAVAAVLGAIFVLIGLFHHPPPPPPPAEQFMRNNLLPAFTGPKPWILPAPAGWNADKEVPPDNPYNPH